jgi:acetoacetyl-CoA synthetase
MDLPISQSVREAALALDGYQPKPYSGPLVLFRSAALQTGRFHDPKLGWGEFAHGGLTVYEILGTHQELLREPAVEIVAAHLKATLAQAVEQ